MGAARRAWMVAAVVALGLQIVALYSPGSLQPDVGIPGFDKLVHLALFAVPVWLFLHAGVSRWIVLMGAVAQTVFSEIAQTQWVPHRHGDILDALTDLCGIALGYLLAVRSLRPQRSTRPEAQMSSKPNP